MIFRSGLASAGPFLLGLFALIVCSGDPLIASSQSVHPKLSHDSLPPRLIVRIEHRDTATLHQLDTVDITLESRGIKVAGFGLKIAGDDNGPEIIDILPGAYMKECSWELFTASPLAAQASRPHTRWQIHALAKASADTLEATCLIADGTHTLARIVVSAESWSEGVDGALYFYWEDCRDNVFSDNGGSQLYVSASVIDYIPNPTHEGRSTFPNRTGAPSTCISPRAVNAPKRLIEFHNGGIGGPK